MSYCGNCGSQLIPNAKFCGNCGMVQQSQPQQANINQQYGTPNSASGGVILPPPPNELNQFSSPVSASISAKPANGETVIGTIFLRRMKSLGRYDSFTGVVTNQRLIFAQLTSQMAKDAAMQARDKAKAEGKGFFAQWSEQLKATFSYTQRYLTMAPAAILAETPGNFAIDNGAISEIKFSLKDLNRSDDSSAHEYEIRIVSAQGQYIFRTEDRQENVNLMRNVYGQRVKTPLGFSSRGFNVRIGH